MGNGCKYTEEAAAGWGGENKAEMSKAYQCLQDGGEWAGYAILGLEAAWQTYWACPQLLLCCSAAASHCSRSLMWSACAFRFTSLNAICVNIKIHQVILIWPRWNWNLLAPQRVPKHVEMLPWCQKFSALQNHISSHQRKILLVSPLEDNRNLAGSLWCRQPMPYTVLIGIS